MMHMDPPLGTISTYYYDDKYCLPKAFHKKTGINVSIKRTNSVEREYDFHIQGAFFSVSEEYLSHLNCSRRVKPGHEYPVTAYHCVDENGQNPFADLESDVGRTVHGTVIYYDDAVHFVIAGQTYAFRRQTSTGCDSQFFGEETAAGKSTHFLLWVVAGALAVVVVLTMTLVLRSRSKNNEDTAEVTLV